MDEILSGVESWVRKQYATLIGDNEIESQVAIRWLGRESVTRLVPQSDAFGLSIEDQDIGLIFYVFPFDAKYIQKQVTQALTVRSRLQRESNYTGDGLAKEGEDRDGSWRVGILWIVSESHWDEWQKCILQFRNESAAADEITFDVVRVGTGGIARALDQHGLPRLLLHTRALLGRSREDVEQWISADSELIRSLDHFDGAFETSTAKSIARELIAQLAKAVPPRTAGPVRDARKFRALKITNFRNIASVEISSDPVKEISAQSIVMYGPNGTGKSSIVEALSLAAFGSSARLMKYLDDSDMTGATPEKYLQEYVSTIDKKVSAVYAWKDEESYAERPFSISKSATEETERPYEGVILTQEDSLEFTQLSRDELAGRVLRGYSNVADRLIDWIAGEERRANQEKSKFCQEYSININITRSVTAYNRLAQALLASNIQRPSAEFLGWLRYFQKLQIDGSEAAASILIKWDSYDASTLRLSETLSQGRERNISSEEITRNVETMLTEYDRIAVTSEELINRVRESTLAKREQFENALIKIQVWGAWLERAQQGHADSAGDAQVMKNELEQLLNENAQLAEYQRSNNARLQLLDVASKFVTDTWASQHSDICPVCESDVSKKQGIATTITGLRKQLTELNAGYASRGREISERQRELNTQFLALGSTPNPISESEQNAIKALTQNFIPEGQHFESYIASRRNREELGEEIKRFLNLPSAPKTYANTNIEAKRLVAEYIDMTERADRALELPQGIAEVKKAFERKMEGVVSNHLPATLQLVWREIILAITSASWLLPGGPNMKLERRGKAMSLQVGETGLYARYIYNAAERHVLGLAWFFTRYLASRRFKEAWLVLDDPAQEMDQPSYRELVRFWETLVRIHARKNRPFTLILTLHQEERAIQAARATNGRLYALGWQRVQSDADVKRIVLLAPGYHPLKPTTLYEGATRKQ